MSSCRATVQVGFTYSNVDIHIYYHAPNTVDTYIMANRLTSIHRDVYRKRDAYHSTHNHAHKHTQTHPPPSCEHTASVFSPPSAKQAPSRPRMRPRSLRARRKAWVGKGRWPGCWSGWRRAGEIAVRGKSRVGGGGGAVMCVSVCACMCVCGGKGGQAETRRGA